MPFVAFLKVLLCVPINPPLTMVKLLQCTYSLSNIQPQLQKSWVVL